MAIDLDGILKRQKKRREILAYLESREADAAAKSGRFRSEYNSGPVRDDIADIDVLLAEVERLGELAYGPGEWMRFDAETVLDSMSDIREDCGGRWPHVDRALDKIDAIMKTLAAGRQPDDGTETRGGGFVPAWLEKYPIVNDDAPNEQHRGAHRHASGGGILMGCMRLTLGK